jgi:hypothetical protein
MLDASSSGHGSVRRMNRSDVIRFTDADASEEWCGYIGREVRTHRKRGVPSSVLIWAHEVPRELEDELTRRLSVRHPRLSVPRCTTLGPSRTRGGPPCRSRSIDAGTHRSDEKLTTHRELILVLSLRLMSSREELGASVESSDAFVRLRLAGRRSTMSVLSRRERGLSCGRDETNVVEDEPDELHSLHRCSLHRSDVSSHRCRCSFGCGLHEVPIDRLHLGTSLR